MPLCFFLPPLLVPFAQGAGSLAAGCLLPSCCPLAGWLLFQMFCAKKTKKYAMTSTRRHLTKGKKLPDNLTFDTHHEQKKAAR
jgi:hypothetical protein